MSKKPNPQKEVDAWNQRVQVGDAIEYVDHPGAPVQRFTTATSAEVLSGHTAVVWLVGKRGCVSVGHCRPVAGVQL